MAMSNLTFGLAVSEENI